ncbi:hypothetical protein QUB25_22135 [Microcoleus sp. B3-D7]
MNRQPKENGVREATGAQMLYLRREKLIRVDSSCWNQKVVQGFYRFPCFAVFSERLNPLPEQPEEIGTKFDSWSGGFLSQRV